MAASNARQRACVGTAHRVLKRTTLSATLTRVVPLPSAALTCMQQTRAHTKGQVPISKRQ